VRALASPLASGLTRREAAELIGVDERTIRRWAKLPGFADELAKAHIREQSRRERASEGDTSGETIARTSASNAERVMARPERASPP
jgi:hypothetical protein